MNYEIGHYEPAKSNITMLGDKPTIQFFLKDELIAEFADGKFKYKGQEIDDVDNVYSAFKEWITEAKKLG